ncbi:MAG TPA: trehalose-phosphatase [Solirubrobacterales bacterium]|nr:trehalose-phosphatase [Solirubrobacterales bacterium]
MEARIAQLIAALRADPGSAAVLCDVDGTLAPIVGAPESAVVPEETRDALRALAGRYALVACVSGRRAIEARRLVGIDELTYAGNHGLELLAPRAEEAIVDPAPTEGALTARDFIGELEGASLDGAGLRLEDKGPIQALHWRGAADEEVAERHAGEIAEAAREAGLEPHRGRKVLEIRPASGIDKGTAVERLLSGQRIERALFAGDDRTDLDAFRALRSLVAAGSLAAGVCIGIDSSEAPEELSREADAVVGGTEEFRGVLRALGEPRAGAPGAAGG